VSAFEAILERVSQVEPDLIVMGTHGRTALGRLLMGSTAEKVLRHAPGNVLTVKRAVAAPGPGEPLRVLVPVDFSDGAARALDAARWLSHERPTRLHLLHVVEPLPAIYDIGGVGAVGLEGELRPRLEETLREWSGDLDDARWSVAQGVAALEIARIAQITHSDLVVMGTRGLSGLEHVLIGSVTERVCRTCEVPVLVVRDQH